MRAFAMSVMMVLVTIIFLVVCGPWIFHAANYVRPPFNGSLNNRMEEAAYRGATRAIQPHHDADMQEHRRTQSQVGQVDTNVGAVAGQLSRCFQNCGTKTTTTRRATTETTRKETVTTTATKRTEEVEVPASPVDTYECAERATGELARELMKRGGYADCRRPPAAAQASQPCGGCGEQRHEEKRETRKEEKREEPCLDHYGFMWHKSRSCDAKPKDCNNCDQPGGSRAR